LLRRGHKVLIYTLNHAVPRLSELNGSGVEVVVDQKRLRLDPLSSHGCGAPPAAGARK